MRLKLYPGIFCILLLISQGVFAQNSADYRVIQTTSKDTLYLDFEIRRTSVLPYYLAGYNLVFNIDTSVINAGSYKLTDQGTFGSVPGKFGPTRIFQINANQYQLTLLKDGTAFSTTTLSSTFVNVGKVAFLIEKCGTSAVTFNKSKSATTISGWLGNVLPPFEVDATEIPSALLPLVIRSNFKLRASRDTICRNSLINIAALPLSSSGQYSLYLKGSSINSQVGVTQSSPLFNNVPVFTTSEYFVTFRNSTCIDTSDIIKVVTVDPPARLKIAPPLPPVCVSSTLTLTSSVNSTSNHYQWNILPSTAAQFVGASSGAGKNSVLINFLVNTAVKVVVRDTSRYGCPGTPDTVTVNVTKCDLNLGFTVNGSDSATSCQNKPVKFNDISTSSSGIKKRSWDFGPGATADTSNPLSPVVFYNTAGLVTVKLTLTDNNNQTRTLTKSSAVRILSGLSGAPSPACGSSSCNEVNFNWQPVAGATAYKISYSKGKNGIQQPFLSVGKSVNFQITSASPGLGGSLEFSDTKNDTIYFRVMAIAGKCDSVISARVFCRPSYCSSAGCKLPSVAISTPSTACTGSNIRISVATSPVAFYNNPDYRTVRFVFNNGAYDTSHIYTLNIGSTDFQKATLVMVDTAKPTCYTLNTISIPVSKTLTGKPDLGIQSLECDRATFVWKHVDGAQKYQIRYSGSCSGFQDWIDSPLSGQAEFFEVIGLTNGCKINFQVKAVGGCNVTQSDTLISPPTCTCYTGHIASSSLRSCALDTVMLKVTDIQSPNWLISWTNVNTGVSAKPSRDSVYRFVPALPNQIYRIKYTIYDLTKTDSCKTEGYITDTTGSSADPEWDPVKTRFCISDVLFFLDNKPLNKGYSFTGPGVQKISGVNFFNAAKAGIGTHLLSYNACGSKRSRMVEVIDKPCVTTVVEGQNLIKNPNDLYTACDGTIYITDDYSIWKYLPGGINGIPELVAKSNPGLDVNGNLSAARFSKPHGIVLDESTGNELYFADYDNHKIKKVVFDKSRIDSVAGSIFGNRPNNTITSVPVSQARFFNPYGLSMHPNADTLYVSDFTTNSIKSFTFKVPNPVIKLTIGNQSGTGLPGRGKSVNVTPRRIAADSLGMSFTDQDGFIGRYQFSNDIVTGSTIIKSPGYADGLPSQYQVRSKISGVTPRIGDWIYFTDELNFSLRRVNAVTGYMETVAGSPPPNKINGIADGPAKQALFNQPTALSFNIKGYIDILDIGPGGLSSYVRRFYIPRWGVGTWDNFDSVYVANCDSDTLTPSSNSGTLRVVKGSQNALVNNIFAPKTPGEYLLAYKIKVGRCDTTFFKTVTVKAPPVPVLKNDTSCLPVTIIRATAVRDTSVRYKWFGPDVRTLPIAISDTNRAINITASGKYWVEIFYGKTKKCSIQDSAIIKIIKGQVGKINNDQPGNPKDSVTLCYGANARLSIDELSVTAPKFKNFLWSTGETTRAITATGSANYTVVAKDTLGCDITARFKVLQQSLPNICIKAVDINSGRNLGWGTYTVSTLAGKAGVAGAVNAKGTSATFFAPWGLTLYKDTLYVSDKNNLIRSVSLMDGSVNTFLGKAGINSIVDSVPKSGIVFNTPQGIRFDKAGNLYVANTGANNIAKYDRAKNLYYILAGSGTAFYLDSTGKNAHLNQPYDLEIDAAGNVIFTDNQNHAIRTIDSRRRVGTLVGTAPVPGQADGKGVKASLNWPWGITMDPAGNIFLAEDANFTLRKIGLDSSVKLVGGAFLSAGSTSNRHWNSVPGSAARFNKPWNTASDQAGNIFITDAGNNLIRLLDTKGNVVTIAGRQGIAGNKDGRADSATFSNITGIVSDPKTQHIYVADQNNHTIRKLTRNKTVYICRGNLYSLADSCTNARTDLIVTWKKKAANGTFVTQFGGAPTNVADTGTFLMEVRFRQNVCPNVVSDTIRVLYQPVDSTFRITRPADQFTQACFGDSIVLAATPGYSEYQWFIQSGSIELPLFTSTSNVSKISIDTSGIFKLVVYARNKITGCLDRLRGGFEKQLYVTPRLKANFTSSLTCLGNITRFEPVDSDTLNSTYKWNFGNLTTLGDTSNSVIGQYEYPNSGNYSVTMIATDPLQNSCADTVKKVIAVTSLPKLTLSLNGAVTDSVKYCGIQSQNLNLKANFTPDLNSAPPFTFQWLETGVSAGLNTATTSADNSAAPALKSNEYSALFKFTVFVKDKNNCSSNKDTVSVRLSKLPEFHIQASKTQICLGELLTLTATDTTQSLAASVDYSYKWLLSGIRQNSDTNNPVLSVSPLLSSAYTLVVKNKVTGCTATLTSPIINVIGFRVNINPVGLPVPCSDPDSVTVSALVSGNPAAPLQVNWTDIATGNPSPSLYNPSALSVKVFNDSTRFFRLFVSDNTGCTNADTIKVQGTSRRIPKFGFQITPVLPVCKGQIITFTPVDSVLNPPQPQNYTYEWDSSGVNLRNNLYIPVLESRAYDNAIYKLTVKDINNGCVASFNTALSVIGFDLSIDPVVTAPCSPTTSRQLKPGFNGNAAFPLVIQWTDSSGSLARSLDNPEILNPMIFNDSTRTYKLFVKDNAGCFDSAYVRVQGTSTIAPRFGLILSPNDTVCRGEEITLTPFDSTSSPVNHFNFVWDSSGTAVNASGNPVLVKKPRLSVNYVLKVQSKNSGCIQTISAPPISVSGFFVAIDSVINPVPCSQPGQVPLKARITSGNALEPLTTLWTDNSTGKIPASINNPTQFEVLSFRDSTRTYRFSVKDAAGCEDYSVIKVQGTSKIAPQFNISMSEPGPICRGKEVTFTPVNLKNPSETGDYTFTWDSSGVVINPNSLNEPVLKRSPQNSVQYTLRVRSKHSGCDTVLRSNPLVVNGYDVILTLQDPLIPCTGPDSARIEARITSNQVSKILWTDSVSGKASPFLYNPVNRNVKVFRDQTRTYKLTVTDLIGCESFNTIKVRANSLTPPEFSVITGRDTGVCVGNSVPVSLVVTKGTAPFKFEWKDLFGNIANEVNQTNPLNPKISAPAAAPGNSRKYYVYMQDADACFAPRSDSVNVTLYDMSVSIAGTETSLCRSVLNPDPPTDFVARISGPGTGSGTPFLFKWTNLSTGETAGNSNDLPFVNKKGLYEVEVTNLLTSCIRKATKEIRLLNTPESSVLNIISGSVCNNEPINLSVSFNEATVKLNRDSIVYNWTITNGTNTLIVKDSSAAYNPSPADTNSLVFRVYTSNRCGTDSAVVSTIKLRPGPIANLKASPLETRPGKDVVFTNNTLNSDSVNLLNIEGGINTTWGSGNGQTYTNVYFSEGDFKAKLYSINKSGCSSADSLIIVVTNKQDIFVPNVFSPEANQEENSAFRIFGQNLSAQDFNLVVYNRWGQVVFVTTDLSKAMNAGWDGKDSSGPAQMGAYTYTLKGKYNSGVEFEKTGTVTLIR